MVVNQNYLQWTCKGKTFAIPYSKHSVISLNWSLLIFLSLLVITWRNRIKVRDERLRQGIKAETVKCWDRLSGEAVESPLLVFDVCLILSEIKQAFVENDRDSDFVLRKRVDGFLKSLPESCHPPLYFPGDLHFLGVSACPLLFSWLCIMEASDIIAEYLSVTSCFSFSLIFQLHFGCYISKIAYDLVKLQFSKP